MVAAREIFPEKVKRNNRESVGWRQLASRSSDLARRIFLGSLIYLPTLSILLILDRSLI